MTSVEELQRLIGQGEDTQTEFKAELSEEVLKGLPTDLAAIANSQGGRIIFGVSDDKDPIGITLTGGDLNRISQCASSCLPAILAEPEDIRFGSRSFIVVKIPKSTLVHSDHQKKFPIRLGTTTHYLDALTLVTLLLERGLFRTETPHTSQLQQFQQVKQEKLPIPNSEAAGILAHLNSKDPTIRLEALRDLTSVQYRTIILTSQKITDSLGRILTSGNPAEVKTLLDLLRGLALWGSSEEKKVVSGWASTILKVAKTSPSPDLSRSAFNVLMYSKHRGAVDLLLHWAASLDDSEWTAIQPANMLRDLAYQRTLAQDEMYKILEDPKTGEGVKKRALAVLEAIRQIP